jgi:septal ring-binding cell division protein DamX
VAAVTPPKQKRAKKPAPAPKKKARVETAREPAAPSEPATPNLLGLSRREAVTRAHAEGFTVQVSGVGWVAGQEPAPGTPFGRERTLALRLTPEIMTASP